jgi:hypothetical protein
VPLQGLQYLRVHEDDVVSQPLIDHLVLNQAAFFEVPGAFLGWMRWGSWGQP